MTDLPPPATGDDPFVTAWNRLLQCVKERTPLDSETCDLDFLGERGFRIKPLIEAAAGGEVQQWRVKQVHKDHLICNSYAIDEDGVETIGDDEVQIAKPFDLRATPWATGTIDNRTYNFPGGTTGGNGSNLDVQKNPHTLRTVTIFGPPTQSGQQLTFSEYFPQDSAHPVILHERIWPEWIPLVSVIYAVKVKEKPIVTHASVFLAKVSGVDIYSEDVSCEWIDLNVDAKRWEMIWKKIPVCIDDGAGGTTRTYVLVRCSEQFT